MNSKQWIAGFALLILMFACAKKEEAHHEDQASNSNEWKEMDEFHMIMAETFHPYKDSANLEPIKTRASELAGAAEKWANSPLPEKANNDSMKGKLEDLKNSTSALVQTVNAGDNDAIKTKLTQVHDLFHSIQESWYGNH
jgi:hypothetical protein